MELIQKFYQSSESFECLTDSLSRSDVFQQNTKLVVLGFALVHVTYDESAGILTTKNGILTL